MYLAIMENRKNLHAQDILCTLKFVKPNVLQ